MYTFIPNIYYIFTHLHIFIPTHIDTYPYMLMTPTHLHIFIHITHIYLYPPSTYLHILMPTQPLTYIHTFIPSTHFYLPICIFIYMHTIYILSTDVYTYPTTCLPTYIHLFLPNYLSTSYMHSCFPIYVSIHIFMPIH